MEYNQELREGNLPPKRTLSRLKGNQNELNEIEEEASKVLKTDENSLGEKEKRREEEENGYFVSFFLKKTKKKIVLKFFFFKKNDF